MYNYNENAAQEYAPAKTRMEMQSSPANRIAQIPLQCETLEKEIAAQRDTIERLANRIQPALSLAATSAQRGEINSISPPDPTCPIANSLAAAVREVAANSAIISDLLSRLEI